MTEVPPYWSEVRDLGPVLTLAPNDPTRMEAHNRYYERLYPVIYNETRIFLVQNVISSLTLLNPIAIDTWWQLTDGNFRRSSGAYPVTPSCHHEIHPSLIGRTGGWLPLLAHYDGTKQLDVWVGDVVATLAFETLQRCVFGIRSTKNEVSIVRPDPKLKGAADQ